MSTADQTHSARLHGEALLAAQEPLFQSVIDRLAGAAEGRDDLRLECAGLLAGWWFASPDTQYGYELIAVGLLLLAGPVDGDLLVHWVRVGVERRTNATTSYDPSR
jgi:hypothetical protein